MKNGMRSQFHDCELEKTRGRAALQALRGCYLPADEANRCALEAFPTWHSVADDVQGDAMSFRDSARKMRA